jgi:hypothetical protein
MLDRAGGSTLIVEAGFKVDAVNFSSGDKLIGRVGTEAVRSPHPYALMLPPSETERLRALGIPVEREVDATAITPIFASNVRPNFLSLE